MSQAISETSSPGFFSSKQIVVVCFLFLAIANLFGYPKWNKPRTGAVISHDVSGYYMYLPAIFIYKDLKKCDFKDEILKKYRPTPILHQAFLHSSGNYVMKYSCGMALQYLPFFAVGHLWATNSDKYPADGFSMPYQFMINLGSLLITLIGLILLRKILIRYFEDRVVAAVIFTLVFGTNYLGYTAFSGAMSHNYLFTIYAGLILSTIHFYDKPTFRKSLLLGSLVGLAALSRPTEILSALIPILWGVNIFSKESIFDRIEFLKKNSGKVAGAVAVCLAFGSLQLIYWKYVTGDWIVYSYEDQGFSWLSPHIYNCMFSAKSGWLTYTPVMVFSLIGFYFLYKKDQSLWTPTFIFSFFFMYVAFAWDIWWYGGAIGQRTMVQAYAILVFPLAAFYDWLLQVRSWYKYAVGAVIAVFIYISMWFALQGRDGGMLRPGEMTSAYLWKTIGTYKKVENDLKLLDTDEEFTGTRCSISNIYFNDFENNSNVQGFNLKNGNTGRAMFLDKTNQHTTEIFVPLKNNDAEWVRVAADFYAERIEWSRWKKAQLLVKFYNDNTVVKGRMIRVFRFLKGRETKNIFLDVKCPKGKTFNKVGVKLWNAESDKELLIDNLKIESYNPTGCD